MIEFLALNGYDLFVPDEPEDRPPLGLWIESVVADLMEATSLSDRIRPFIVERA